MPTAQPICKYCKQPYIPKRGSQITCGDESCVRARRQELRKARDTQPPPRIKNTCKVCGKVFRSRRSDAPTCSLECGYEWRSKQKKGEAVPPTHAELCANMPGWMHDPYANIFTGAPYA